MNMLFVLILIFGFLFFVSTSIGIKHPTNDIIKNKYTYTKKKYFMTKSEHEFFDILISSFGDKYYIFSQVHLATILNHKIKGQNYRGALAHIDRKSVDFVLCDKKYIEPILAIEVDDSTHRNPDRVQRDTIVENIFKEVKMPLIRFENHGHFNKEEIEKIIFSVI